jgi:hypothetical protein
MASRISVENDPEVGAIMCPFDPDREFLILNRFPSESLHRSLSWPDASVEELRRFLLRACRVCVVTWEERSRFGRERFVRLEAEHEGRPCQFVARFTHGVDRAGELRRAPDGVKICVFFSGFWGFRWDGADSSLPAVAQAR